MYRVMLLIRRAEERLRDDFHAGRLPGGVHLYIGQEAIAAGVGDEAFKKGEPLYEIETEKVTQEIEAPGDGRLLEILVAEDEDADAGQEVCVVELE